MHWYTAHGAPLYEVTRADGKGKRATTLADARKLKLFPSVTTIIGQLSKPGLERWKFEQSLQALKNTAKRLSIYDPSFDKEVYKESIKATQETAKLGTEIHNALEDYYTKGECKVHKDIVIATKKAIDKIIKTTSWQAEPSFAHHAGFGGKIDLLSKKGFIIDFKTKRGTQEDLDTLSLFDDYGMQLAAYRLGAKGLIQKKEIVRCFNVLISVDHVGAISIREWKEEELIKYEKMFYMLLRFWQIRANMEIQCEVDIPPLLQNTRAKK